VGRRISLLITAVVVAALGTTLVFLYVKGADDRALRDTDPQQVLVANARVAAGTSVQEASNRGAFVLQALPRVAIADGAVSSINPIRDKVALTTIFPGQQVLTQMFGDSTAASGPFNLSGGMLAVSFSFADPNRVAGFVQPGSWVAVFLTDESKDTTRVLLDRTQVVAVGPSTVGGSTGSGGSGNGPGTGPGAANAEQPSRALLTLALNQANAEKMIHASSKGTLYLGLLTGSSKIDPTTAGITGAKLFN
jgi:pilus assembly protein CpaB